MIKERHDMTAKDEKGKCRTMQISLWIFKIASFFAFSMGYIALKSGDMADGILMLSVAIIIIIGTTASRITMLIKELEKEVRSLSAPPPATPHQDSAGSK